MTHRFGRAPLLVATILLSLFSAATSAQDTPPAEDASLPPTTQQPPGDLAGGLDTAETAENPLLTAILRRMEEYAAEGRMPSYEDLRLPGEEGRVVVDRYLQSLPAVAEDIGTTDTVFTAAPESPFALLGLRELIDIALDNNFDLINARRGLVIAESESRGAEAFYKPFIDVVADTRVFKETASDEPSTTNPGEDTQVDTTGYDIEGGLEATQNLVTGGSLTAAAVQDQSQARRASGDGVTESETFSPEARVRFNQPLLRGSGLLTGEGTDIGTSDLRRTRLAELDQSLSLTILRRDTVLNVIRQYFAILRNKQQLLVSRDAVRERYRFLDETRIKYDVGRVAESQILTAEIQFLQEIEQAINRRQALDDARENLLLILGLPLDTEISLIDMTPYLREQGRAEIPLLQEALTLAANGRTELMRADISVELSRISADVAQNDVLPDLDFDAGFRTFDSDDNFDDANNYDRNRADAGLSLRIPLQNIQRREAARRSRIRVQQSETDRLELERALTAEVIQAHRAVLTTEARLTVLQKQVEQARRNLELNNDSFEVGFSTITEVRLAQDDLFSAETAYSNALLSYQIAIADLYVAMGLPLM